MYKLQKKYLLMKKYGEFNLNFFKALSQILFQIYHKLDAFLVSIAKNYIKLTKDLVNHLPPQRYQKAFQMCIIYSLDCSGFSKLLYQTSNIFKISFSIRQIQSSFFG
jgi:hypothetical protein